MKSCLSPFFLISFSSLTLSISVFVSVPTLPSSSSLHSLSLFCFPVYALLLPSLTTSISPLQPQYVRNPQKPNSSQPSPGRIDCLSFCLRSRKRVKAKTQQQNDTCNNNKYISEYPNLLLNCWSIHLNYSLGQSCKPTSFYTQQIFSFLHFI